MGWNPQLFPSPSQVFKSLGDLLRVSPAFDARLLIEAPLVSLARLCVGFVISIAIGAALGLAMWRFVEFDNMVGPLLLGLQTLPSVCWVPLAVLLVGGDEQRTLFVVVLGSFSAIAIALRDGLRMIPPVYQRAGLMLGADGWKLYRYILLPASLPALATSLRQGFSFAWRSLMGAEMLFMVMSRKGLGCVLELAQNNVDVGQVVAIMVVMVVIGMAADRWVFARVQKNVQVRFGLA